MFFELKKFCEENKVIVLWLIFFNILAYGYFITHWTLSIDSETQTFASSTFLAKSWFKEGRLLIPFINLLDNQEILPFWNDLISIILIFLSNLTWLTILSKNQKHSDTSSFVFSLTFSISPLYCLYLRFTTFNISISLSILFIALSAYYLSNFFNLKAKRNLAFCFIYTFLAISIYQALVAYYITAIVFIILTREVDNHKCRNIFCCVKEAIASATILILALTLYEILMKIIYLYIPKSNYLESFYAWNRDDYMSIFKTIMYFFHTYINISFNFMFTLSIIPLLLLIVFFIYKKRFHLFTLIILTPFLPFTLIFILGTPVPLRSLIAVPLMLAGLWTLLTYILKQAQIKLIILLVVIISSFFNAQFINRIFYSDVMRQEYDINLANHIYNHTVDKVGSNIETKPLIIIGPHDNIKQPFSFEEETLSRSIFTYGDENRATDFMTWLGKEFVHPTKEQISAAREISIKMPSYPSKGYIKETKNLIIIKLSNNQISHPVQLNLNDYEKLPKNDILSNIDIYKKYEKETFIAGWAFIKSENPKKTKYYIRIYNPHTKLTSFYSTRTSKRPDVAEAFKNLNNIEYSGFEANLKAIIEKSYKISLILVNSNKSYAVVNIKQL
ncbi:glucosyltransferase domain-containing protein [Francisella salimarina]|uniref:Glucosyltransferase domain-containing protein n=1 Tax=Francisella salimarina TaxID=2599927 RepID=A0AAJ4NMZ7_9GAMM|nr:glucosyltransferase domain-containing protein [Francisella salimarina]QWU98920.1 glucosyltransferase domain-containing protein [Francisella salimarina]